MRLDKFLADMRSGTRSQVKEFIKKGMVTVNGNVVSKADFKVDEEKDCISLNGKHIAYCQYRYYMLNKPAGVVTATSDRQERTVMDLFPEDMRKRLFPVGRLDKDTEGLLLITDNGELAHKLLSPKKHVPKTYRVVCKGNFDDEKAYQLRTGVDIGDDRPTKPAEVELLSQENDTYVIKLTITEGRFHQVKRMVKAIGGEVTYLKRLSMGSLTLDDTLELGEYRELTPKESEELCSLL